MSKAFLELAERSMCWIVCLVGIGLLLPAARSAGAERAPLRVATPQWPQHPVKFAADELARYLGKISGALLLADTLAHWPEDQETLRQTGNRPVAEYNAQHLSLDCDNGGRVCTRFRASSLPLSKAIPRRPSNCCPWSTTNCAAWPPR